MKSTIKGLTNKDISILEDELLLNMNKSLDDKIIASCSFTPSIYSGTKSATTTVTGQSEAIATGATKIQIVNKDATNGVYIGFGISAAAAEEACSLGTAGVNKFLILADSIALQVVTEYTHYAWLGVGGTVSLRITQGV